MFTYGVLRESYSPIYKNTLYQYDKKSNIYINSFMNGLYYTSPFGLLKLYHLYKRIRERSTRTITYSDYYKEWSYHYNMNVFF
jgi:hypothetical protein